MDYESDAKIIIIAHVQDIVTAIVYESNAL